mmetsp:Transcript_58145/g.102247  ORF Transcript_58145/g.102247 Transcript_58145/m.102247 type:complete len:312 (+) Transcript_58145:250-1185(+)
MYLVRLDLGGSLVLHLLGLVSLLQERVGEAHGHEHEEEHRSQEEVIHGDVGHVVFRLAEGQVAQLVHLAVVEHQAVVEPRVRRSITEAVARDVVAQNVTLVLVHYVFGDERAVPGLVLGVDVRVDHLHLEEQFGDHAGSGKVQVDPLVQLHVVEDHIGHHPDGHVVHDEVDDQTRRQGVHQGGVVTTHAEGGVVHHVAVQVVQIILVVGQQVEQAALVPGQDHHGKNGHNTLHLAGEKLLHEAEKRDKNIQERQAVEDVELGDAGLVHLHEEIFNGHAGQLLACHVGTLLEILPQRVHVVVLRRTQSHEIH